MNTIKIFVSYSHQNEEWVNRNGKYRLIPWLETQLKRTNVIFWTDHILKEHVGELYEKNIRDNINDSDIALLLITQDFTTSDFILDKELCWIKEEFNKDKLKIVPLLISEISELGRDSISWIFDLQTVPNDKKPIIDYKKDDSEWDKIRISILNVLHDRIKKIRSKPEIEKPITRSQYFIKIRPNITCEVWVDGEKNTLANANQITKIPLNKGTFWLDFISAENEQDKYACEYTVANSEELLTVDLESIAKERMEKEKNNAIESDLINQSPGMNSQTDDNELLEMSFSDIALLNSLENIIVDSFEILENGNELGISFQLNDIPVTEGAFFYDGGNCGILVRNGIKVLIFLFTDMIKELLNKLYNANEIMVIEEQGEEIINSYIIAVRKVDKIPDEIIPDNRLSEKIDYFDNVELVKFQEKEKYGFMDSSGTVIVIQPKYDEVFDFSEGLAAVKLNKKFGYIDKTGKEVIPFIYKDAFPLSEGLARVRLDLNWIFVDNTGKEIISCEKYIDVSCFNEGYARVGIFKKIFSLKYLYGFIDKTGKEVTPCQYDEASSFTDGKALVKIKNEEFYIDKSGNRIE